MVRSHLITGATGFVGAALTLELLRCHQDEVAYCLVRAADTAAAHRRLLDALFEAGRAYGIDAAPLVERVRAVRGDVTVPGLGLSREDQWLLGAAGPLHVWHCAASLKNTDNELEEILSHNVGGTERVLDTAFALPIAAFNHVSTAYVAGRYSGLAAEALIDPDREFENRYEWSKQAAEQLVVELCHRAGVPYRILRPSIVIGHSRTLRATSYNGFLSCVIRIAGLTRSAGMIGRALLRRRSLCFVANPDGELNLIPIDSVVDDCVAIDAAGPRTHNRVFHLTNACAPTFESICRAFAELFKLADFTYTDDPDELDGLSRRLYKMTRFERPYLGSTKTFSRDESSALYTSVRHGAYPMDHAELIRIIDAVTSDGASDSEPTVERAEIAS